MDYQVHRCTRHCTASGREIQPGETFYSTLEVQGAEVVRHDYAADAWTGPPTGVLGWWQSVLPSPSAKRVRWAPNDVMLDLVEELSGSPDRADMCYVLALLLVRRRVVRLEETEHDAQGREISVLYCPRREATYRVPTVVPSDERAAAIQQELSELLFAKPAD
ncbi:MAG TPA: hypothetical protein VMF30_15490 [Pirellulales bacterium]|nr:hypothetical protein [Pirellulales bacterium]